ncbi:cytoplasmic protein [Mesorhizobium sp. LHD-90]|uniref:cytoplasmic protein n=1 Tax=Mesorhizobium sp. LHD-90 TaxID=3071414 RepID=UPI0027E09B96|nr:cytoplasmic protein [Mesorhizobium sp. LHD-90]MDQ6436853.1 cytoplasmic protein [Mesorhizobium sp. LHD-90]
MNDLGFEIRTFLAGKKEERAKASQLVAVQIVCGQDLSALLDAGKEARQTALGRIRRLLARERLKGLSGHWSYDLNRHIALKQACDRLQDVDAVRGSGDIKAPGTRNGARRRRPQSSRIG